MKVIYRSYNPEGVWPLQDKDWLHLEEAGWTVEWGNLCFCGNFSGRVAIYPYDLCDPNECLGHRVAKSYGCMINSLLTGHNIRYLDALAVSAWKNFNSLEEGIKEWERVTHRCHKEHIPLECGCCSDDLHSFQSEVVDGRDPDS